MTVCELRNSLQENSSCLRIRKTVGMKTLARKRRRKNAEMERRVRWGEGGDLLHSMPTVQGHGSRRDKDGALKGQSHGN